MAQLTVLTLQFLEPGFLLTDWPRSLTGIARRLQASAPKTVARTTQLLRNAIVGFVVTRIFSTVILEKLDRPLAEFRAVRRGIRLLAHRSNLPKVLPPDKPGLVQEANPGRTKERPQGPACDALALAAGIAARLLS